MLVHFEYEKSQVLQALRYHFISKKEIRLMIILVNVFTLVSVILYAFKKILPVAFLVGSLLWLILMVSFWYILPLTVYKRAETFRHKFSIDFGDEQFTLHHERGSRSWPWSALSYFIESPHFFHLYYDSRSFFLVPKAALKTPEELQELRDLLKQKTVKK